MYLLLKHLHITLVALSFLIFFMRGIWMFLNSSMLAKKWVKITPHVVNTLMLASGIAVAVHLGMSPGNQPWLMAKIIGLIIYIGLGVVAFKASNHATRKIFWVAALCLFIYIIGVAITKSPTIFF